MRRLTGNQGTSHLGVLDEKKQKTRRTRPTNLVLGPVIVAMLDELCIANGCSQSEMVRTLIERAHARGRA